MPSAITDGHSVPQVTAVGDLLSEALDHARIVKPTSSIEPALNKSDFESLLARLVPVFTSAPTGQAADRARQYAVIETAARDLFSNLIAGTPIGSPEFVQVWNLFDILSILSDNEQCDAALLFWLVEELLDSQTIEGCRTVFDFLESRRDRITAKNFQPKKLVILRACNELLRRLSRAEDTAFCGRVFIFMFQSFPLHDRSSVNLRGEYHAENVTTFEEAPANGEDIPDKMEVDIDSEADKAKDEKDPKSAAKAVSFDAKNKPAPDKPVDMSALYPVFWSLQHFFSQPMTLFDGAQFTKFKKGMDATLSAFETVDKLQKTSKTTDETKIVPQKRKSPEAAEERDGSNYNPKYLTSRDLFELEISDLYFRRHILIQALIIIEFLLSLTPLAKSKLASIKQPNKAVVYNEHVLSDEDAKWTRAIKERITSYLQAGPDGYFFFRIVDSVLSRDKGWAFWKAESCPTIEKPAVAPAEYSEAMASARRLATNKRLRPTPMGSMSLDFLKGEDSASALERLKDPARWKLPDLQVFKEKIAADDLDMDFANTEKEKGRLIDSKASKTWRALRIARGSRLAAFDKIEDWQNIEAIFQEQPDSEDEAEKDEGPKGRRPEDQRPIVLSGSAGVGRSTLAGMLLDKQNGVFGKVVQHTTRSPQEGEVDGRDYHFVDAKTFNTIRDGDYFLEFRTREEVSYGTSRKAADALAESEKIPLIILDREGCEMAKDNGYSARFILITPPSPDDVVSRLTKDGKLSEDSIQEAKQNAIADLEQSKNGEHSYDITITNDDVEKAYESLERFIYDTSPKTNGGNESTGEDVAMDDTPSGEANPAKETNEPAEA
ncbi:hypothetical protein SLS62_006583 [Diatrype stigma]|uniref:Guanylate kinase-like domain-containing protein n=1 Tax=Diatrype stigma TaxID=117547 RepID=A0AAN9UPL4_9PEZI